MRNKLQLEKGGKTILRREEKGIKQTLIREGREANSEKRRERDKLLLEKGGKQTLRRERDRNKLWEDKGEKQTLRRERDRIKLWEDKGEKQTMRRGGRETNSKKRRKGNKL